MASRVPSAMSSSWYFTDEEPELRTRTRVAVTAWMPSRWPWAWIAVMATVLTMSWTSAPRERSLTGLRSPCSTGPTATAPAERCTAL